MSSERALGPAQSGAYLTALHSMMRLKPLQTRHGTCFPEVASSWSAFTSKVLYPTVLDCLLSTGITSLAMTSSDLCMGRHGKRPSRCSLGGSSPLAHS